jgi:hypothetical protein
MAYSCELCGRSFERPMQLLGHKGRAHKGTGYRSKRSSAPSGAPSAPERSQAPKASAPSAPSAPSAIPERSTALKLPERALQIRAPSAPKPPAKPPAKKSKESEYDPTDPKDSPYRTDHWVSPW